MKIQVTQDDIDHGCRAESGPCPLALAVRRQTSLVDPHISIGAVWHGKDMYRKYFNLPVEASVWYRDFDRGEKVTPFEFELDTVGV